MRPARDPRAARRFRSEIKLARRVRHRNVCAIHEYGEDGELAYIAMEYVEGRDLKRLLAERGPLPWEEAYDIALQVAEGLRAIHEAGVLHRDLKPSNVMRDGRGAVRVMDFGIAKTWGEEDATGLTGSGQVIGSPEYMSPEQAHGRGLDFASDIYSFGILAYELFTGNVPFRRESPIATMLARLEEEVPLEGATAARLPHGLVPVLRKALAREPAERHRNCAELVEELQAARRGLERQRTDPLSGAPGASPALARPDSTPVSPLAPRPDVARLLAEPLRRALQHADASVRAGAAAALASMGPDLVPTVDLAGQVDHDPSPTRAENSTLSALPSVPADAMPPRGVVIPRQRDWKRLAWLGAVAALLALLAAVLWLRSAG
jgi:serine/threonine-protein kinase